MKTTLLAIATLLASIAMTPTASYAQAADKLNPGDAMPTMSTDLQNANGRPTTLQGAAKENGLLVIFSCNTCPFVIKNQPVTNQALEYAAAHHIGVIIVNSNEAQRSDADSYTAMQKYAKEQGYKVPYVIDANSRLADMFGASHTPEVFLFNNQSKLVYKGAMNDNPGSPAEAKIMYVQNAMNAVATGKQVNPATTKSIGCGIKRKA